MATINHIFSSPIADGTDTSLVRPSNWNSIHQFTLQDAVSLTGNTSGVLAAISSGTLYLAGGNNITLSQNANSVTISAAGGVQTAISGISAGTTQATSGTVSFADSNGVSFGVSGQTLTANIQDTYDRMELDAQPWEFIFAGSNITLSESPTGEAITIVGPSPGAASVNFSAGTTSSNLDSVVFSNLNGVTFGLDGSTITASVVPPSGATVNVSAGTTSQNLTQLVFSDSNSIQFGLNGSTLTANYLIDDRAELDAQPWEYVFAGSNMNIVESPTGDAISIEAFDTFDRGELESQPWEYIFAGSNITLTESPTGEAITIHGQTDAITTAMASDAGSRFVNTSAGLNLTSISATFNSNSITLSVGAYITTAMASNRGSDFVQAAAAFAGTNASGTIASGGISVSAVDQTSSLTDNYLDRAELDALPAEYIFAGSNINIIESPTADAITIEAFDTYDRAEEDAMPWEYIFAGSNITLSESPTGDAITIVGPAAGAGGSINFSAGTTSSNLDSVVFSNSNGVSFGINNSTITASVAARFTHSYFAPIPSGLLGTRGQLQGNMFIQPYDVPDVHFDRVLIQGFYSNAVNSSGSVTISCGFHIYTRLDQNTLSRYGSTTNSYALTFSGTDGDGSLNHGVRNYSIGWTTTLSANDYWFAIAFSTASGNADATFSPIVVSQQASAFSGIFGQASATSIGRFFGQGVWTGTSTASPATIAFSDIQGTGTLFQRPIVFYLLSQSTT